MADALEREPAVASPCVGVCRLDGRGHCRGCGRSIDEIAEWPLATPMRQRAIAAAAHGRLAARRTDGDERPNPEES